MSHPIPNAEFDEIFGKVPRLTVEIIIMTDHGVILTKRSIPPSLGKWHIPGGTVRFGEPATDAVIRIAKDELGVIVKPGKILGYIEYPKQNAGGYKGWPVGLAFEATITEGEPRGSEQGEEVGFPICPVQHPRRTSPIPKSAGLQFVLATEIPSQ